MSGDETAGQQQPPERPAAPDTPDDEIDASPEQRREHLSDIITMEPGARRTSNVELLVIEADMVANEGHEPDNPAIPVDTETGEAFRERIEDTELVRAWTRPWEGADE